MTRTINVDSLRRQVLRLLDAMKVYGQQAEDLPRLATAFRGLEGGSYDLYYLKEAMTKAILARAKELRLIAYWRTGILPTGTSAALVWLDDNGGIEQYTEALEALGIQVATIRQWQCKQTAVSGIPVSTIRLCAFDETTVGELQELIACLLDIAWLSAENQRHPTAFLAALATSQ